MEEHERGEFNALLRDFWPYLSKRFESLAVRNMYWSRCKGQPWSVLRPGIEWVASEWSGNYPPGPGDLMKGVMKWLSAHPGAWPRKAQPPDVLDLAFRIEEREVDRAVCKSSGVEYWLQGGGSVTRDFVDYEDFAAAEGWYRLAGQPREKALQRAWDRCPVSVFSLYEPDEHRSPHKWRVRLVDPADHKRFEWFHHDVGVEVEDEIPF